MAKFEAATRLGFPQVEPNHLSAPRNGQVYAQLPADDALGDTLPQGLFVKYDYAAGKVNLTGEGPWMLVYNEEKLYDERHQMHRDYAMQKSDSFDGVMTPRVFKLSAGDLYTTNNLADGTYAVGDKVAPGADGVLAKAADGATGLILKVVKDYTLPDGQVAVKLQVISE